jgi:iron complex outermembrane receptor protein
LSAKDLASTGQATFDKDTVQNPSFNTVQTPVNDATLLDPYEIRNMGPSRTLILINGKRKNMSSLVYTQTSLDVVKQVLIFRLYLLMLLKE